MDMAPSVGYRESWLVYGKIIFRPESTMSLHLYLEH